MVIEPEIPGVEEGIHHEIPEAEEQGAEIDYVGNEQMDNLINVEDVNDGDIINEQDNNINPEAEVRDGQQGMYDVAEDNEILIDDVDDNDVRDLETEMNYKYGERSGRYDLRPRRERDYGHLFITTDGSPLATVQMSMSKGIKMFGEDGTKAVKSELQQLHDRKVMMPVTQQSLTKEQRLRALAYLMFLKRKRCGKVKARGCADGRKQRAYIPRERAASPTVSTEAIFITALIDAMERREVAVIDVPGAFMQADMDEDAYVRFTGKMVELFLLEIDRELYSPFVCMEGTEMVLYVKLLKALYGTIRAARLFWEMLTSKLQEWGFQGNSYDSCVMNKMVNGKQLTVAWHVDDLKVSHVDSKVVDDFIKQMDAEFGKETPMNQSRGKVHDYLGMLLDYSEDGCVKIDMTEYVNMILHELPAHMMGVAKTPAASHLFDINQEAERLGSEEKDEFVHYVMQMLYLSQRGRPDIRTAISFLCTRLKDPDRDDYNKMIRVLKYLQGTKDLTLKLNGTNGMEIRWWVDAAYGVHHDMKGHTGGVMSAGGGSVYTTSSKQKMVSRSSTECEMIGVYDVLTQIQWTALFLSDQGYDVDTSTLYQDNTSAILLETNGRKSSTKRTRHMNIRYFYIKDQVDAGKIKIEYCATDEMLADFFTKPLQGIKFKVFRDQIMNIDLDSKYHSGHRSVLESEDCKEDEEDAFRSSVENMYPARAGSTDDDVEDTGEVNRRECVVEIADDVVCDVMDIINDTV
jgi:hypothetical protein